MEFSEKYELIESVTTGSVESFIGSNRTRGERVLVHILQCEPQKPNQPTVQWVLEAFRKLAPEPAGIVLETGRYSGTTYAYVITTLPDQAELAAWVERYNAQNKDTEELDSPAAPKPSSPNKVAAAEPQPPAQPVQVPVQFTQIFREVDALKRPAVSDPAVNQAPAPLDMPADLPARPIPSLNADRFQSGAQAAPKWDDLAMSPPRADEDTRINRAVPGSPDEFAVKGFPSDTVPPTTPDATKPGEFTGFWQGPFRVEGLGETPISSSPPLESQNKPGEFTMMFRSGPAATEAPAFSAPAPEHDSPRSGLTGWAMHAEIMGQTTHEPAPSPVPKPVGAQELTPVMASPAEPSSLIAPRTTPPRVPALPETPVFPVPAPPPKASPAPAVPSPAAVSPLFQPPSVASIPSIEPMPAGPSPYTQIISVRRPAADPLAGEEPAALKLPSFAAPPKPVVAVPALPKLPPVPKRPAIKAPKAQKPDAPKLDVAKPPVSYWPLVITLTALFFIAVLLVLYFVLKH